MQANEGIPRPLLESLQVVLKISERCNLKCSYCYFFFGGDESWRTHPVSIDLETVEHVAKYLQQLALAHCLPKIELILHGGEPLLLPKDRFRKLLTTFRQHETHEFRFDFSLQTNAVLIDEEWIDIFEEFDILIGVSLDGEKEVNDLHRIDTHGRSSYDDTVGGLRKLQTAAQIGRIHYPGLICVVNPQADGAKTYRHFVDDLVVHDISFRIPIYNHDSDVPVSDIDNINRFMRKALTQWLQDDNPAICVREFQRPLNAMIRDDAAVFTAEFGEDYRNILGISSNGDVGPEDGVRTVHPRFAESSLNASSSVFDDLTSTSVWTEMREAAAKAPEICKQCQWWRLCKGGPLVTRFSNSKGFNNPSIYCEGLKERYTMVAKALMDTGLSSETIARRLQIETFDGEVLGYV